METIRTRLESILEREIENKHKYIQITGSASPTILGFHLSQAQGYLANALPHLIIVESDDVASRLSRALHFFNPQKKVQILPEVEASPYADLIASPHLLQDRLRFLYSAQNALPGEIFIAPVNALSRLVIPYKEFAQNTILLRVGDRFPDPISQCFLNLGYESAPLVEDPGKFALRGGIIDCFSIAEKYPFRIELFGNQIESIRYFNPNDQRNLETTEKVTLVPATECLYRSENIEKVIQGVRDSIEGRPVDASEKQELLRSLSLQQTFSGLENLSSFFYNQLESPINYFSTDLNVWVLEPSQVTTTNDSYVQELKAEFLGSEGKVIRPLPHQFFLPFDQFRYSEDSVQISLTNLDYYDDSLGTSEKAKLEYKSSLVQELSKLAISETPGSELWQRGAQEKLKKWRQAGFKIFISAKNQTQAQRISLYLQRMDFSVETIESSQVDWNLIFHRQQTILNHLDLIIGVLDESLKMDTDEIILLRDVDFLGKKTRIKEITSVEDFHKTARRLNFGDMVPGDLVVHIQHGVGKYEGLKVMPVNGADAEFLQISYKDSDKLYLPVYRLGALQKYSGPATASLLDKLGGVTWSKTKAKVKSHLRDVASDLLQLYAKRSELQRPPFKIKLEDLELFEKGFPFEETADQLRAINDIQKDLLSHQPMDRLICGDVGFGKTEVAMRAAFFGVQNHKQVAFLAPTTVLTFQHFESLKKRFKGWPIEIRCLNRFVSKADVKKILEELKTGKVDILIGTHRILSKDIVFKDLGLLIIDEEQKFGVIHKERIKKIKVSVDTISMSATPIPRTLNMSLMGIRDISLINTAPVDRLPTRTFVSKFNEDTIRRAIHAELKRGGQVYFIHNRVQSIYSVADEVRKIVPEVRLAVAHGQMDEESLEKTMLQFFHHEIDVLICTAIVESGMDVTRANTIFIDSAHMFGISQLYQLRGRVGRSNVRAYCYLLMPPNKKLEKEAQERLKFIQEHTSLGSGIKVAQYDLEIRGAGSILGDEQSGHIDAVGYELYMDLLAEALANAKGEDLTDVELDPEINLRIPALIPSDYVPDFRLRLGYYRALADITAPEEVDQIEGEMQDQFGPLPDPVVNLIGIMLIRLEAKKLGIRDISAGLKAISLQFTDRTPIKTEFVIQLAMRENKKYSITPDSRLNIRMNQIEWPRVLEEVQFLGKTGATKI